MMQDKEKLDDLIDEDPRRNIFVSLILILVLGGIGIFLFVKIVEDLIKLLF